MSKTRSVIYREITPGFEYSDQEIIDAVTTRAEASRKVAAMQRKNLMNDHFKSVIEGVIKHMFVDASAGVMCKYIDVSNNLYRRVMKEISLVYQREPERTVDPAGAMERYEEIVQDMHMDLVLDRGNFMLNGLNDIIMQVVVLGDNISITFITPDQVTVMRNENDPTVVEALCIEVAETDKAGIIRKTFIFWSPTRHFMFKPDPNNEGRFLKISMNETDANPYAEANVERQEFFPFIFTHASYRDECFWDEHTNTSLYEGTILVALQNTFKNFMVPQQFKQLAVKMQTKSDSGGWINDQVSNPLHIFQTNGDMTVLDWQSAIDKLDIVIQNKISQIANDYGISAEQIKLEATAQSGFSRLVAKERIYELRDQQVKFWRIYEAQVYEVIAAANNLYKLGNALPDTAKDALFSVDFAEPKQLIDPKEDLEVKQTKIDMGILSPVDLIMQENPDIQSRDEALAKYQENIADRELIKAAGATFKTPSLSSFQGTNRGQGTAQQGQGA